MSHIKIKNFALQKALLRGLKNWKKIFVNHPYDKHPVSNYIKNIQNTVKNNNNKKQIIQLENGQDTLPKRIYRYPWHTWALLTLLLLQTDTKGPVGCEIPGPSLPLDVLFVCLFNLLAYPQISFLTWNDGLSLKISGIP